jgi:pterin-4a-carbinolamine dehydratase
MCDPLRTARPVAWSTVESFQYIAVDRDGGPVVPCWQLRNFQAALDMFSRVAALAEAEGHHPDLHLTGYNNVAIELSTHSVGEAAHPAAWASPASPVVAWPPALSCLGTPLVDMLGKAKNLSFVLPYVAPCRLRLARRCSS